MIVTGFSVSGAPARPVASGGAVSSTDAPQQQPGHFRQISAISPGSLAAAYQAIRAHEAAIVAPVPAGEAAILSGLGIPSAFEAYREMTGAE